MVLQRTGSLVVLLPIAADLLQFTLTGSTQEGEIQDIDERFHLVTIYPDFQ
jgi:hypothetical protein